MNRLIISIGIISVVLIVATFFISNHITRKRFEKGMIERQEWLNSIPTLIESSGDNNTMHGVKYAWGAENVWTGETPLELIYEIAPEGTFTGVMSVWGNDDEIAPEGNKLSPSKDNTIEIAQARITNTVSKGTMPNNYGNQNVVAVNVEGRRSNDLDIIDEQTILNVSEDEDDTN